MAIFEDDFQGYAIGTNVPFGSWQLNPSAFLAQIVAGGSGVAGTDRNLGIFLGSVLLDPTVPGYQTSFTQFLAYYLSNNFSTAQSLMVFENGPNLSSVLFTILTLRAEVDTTITAYDGGGNVLGNSGDAFLNRNQWNFLQVNVTLSDVLVSGILRVHIAFELGLNGRSVISFSKTVPTIASSLANGTSEVNRFELGGGSYGAFTLDTLQAMVSYPHPGSPKALLYQAPAEVDVLPDTGKIRIIQAPAEVDVLPDTTKLRLIQAVLEVDCKIANRWYISES